MIKKAARSKTMWTAAIISALGVVELQYPLIRELIPAEYQGAVFVAIGVIVAVLRIVTTEPLEDK